MGRGLRAPTAAGTRDGLGLTELGQPSTTDNDERTIGAPASVPTAYLQRRLSTFCTVSKMIPYSAVRF